VIEESEDLSNLDTLIKNNHGLGIVFRLQEKYDQSEIHYQKAIELSTKRHGENSFQTIELKNFLAGLYFVQSKFEQAQDILNSSLKVYKTALGRDHQVVALTNYALAIIKRAEFNTAEVHRIDIIDEIKKHGMSLENCVHCRTCEMICPEVNLRVKPTEQGSGPNFAGL